MTEQATIAFKSEKIESIEQLIAICFIADGMDTEPVKVGKFWQYQANSANVAKAEAMIEASRSTDGLILGYKVSQEADEHAGGSLRWTWSKVEAPQVSQVSQVSQEEAVQVSELKINQKVRVLEGLERNHSATVIAVGAKDEGREGQVRIHFDKNGATQSWGDKWINSKKLALI